MGKHDPEFGNENSDGVSVHGDPEAHVIVLWPHDMLSGTAAELGFHLRLMVEDGDPLDPVNVYYRDGNELNEAWHKIERDDIGVVTLWVADRRSGRMIAAARFSVD